MCCTFIANLVLFISFASVNYCQDFISPPTTVKAIENNTVLLPCYLNTLSNGKFNFSLVIFIYVS